MRRHLGGTTFSHRNSRSSSDLLTEEKSLRVATKPILLSVGVLMATVVVLAVVSMLSSVFVAQTSDGLASAVNQSGSLRMQSYRIGMALADTSVTPSEQAARVERLVSGFEARLASPRLSRAIPTKGSNAVRQAYEKIAGLWRRDMRPSIDEHLAALRADEGSGFTEPPPAEYLTNVDAFVAEVDALVGMLEEVAEGRIDNLRFIQGVSLLLTVLVVAVTMTVVTRGVLGPLGELLAMRRSGATRRFLLACGLHRLERAGSGGRSHEPYGGGSFATVRRTGAASLGEDPGPGANQPFVGAALPGEQDTQRDAGLATAAQTGVERHPAGPGHGSGDPVPTQRPVVAPRPLDGDHSQRRRAARCLLDARLYGVSRR